MSAPVTLAKGLTQWRLDAYIESAAFSPDGGLAAFALGDGRLAVIECSTGQASFFKPHKGSCLSVAAHPAAGFITGGDDGLLAYTSPGGETGEITCLPGRWIERMAASPDGRILAATAGRDIVVLDLEAGSMATLTGHPGTVSGVAISPGGGVLAATHVGGATLWNVEDGGEPARLELTGLSLAPAFSPDGRYLALGHQENAAHIVDLEPRNVFGLSGLPAKPGCLAWALGGGHLMHTGTKAVICWPVPGCFAENPEPVAFAVQPEARMTALDANPRMPLAACGFDDGTLLLADLKRFAAFPLEVDPGAPVSAARWSANGGKLACGLEDGRAVLLDLGEMLAQD